MAKQDIQNFRHHTLRRIALQSALAVVLAMALPALASALPSYSLAIDFGHSSSEFGLPRLTLTNTSTEHEEIVGFSISLGDGSPAIFDFVASPTSTPIANKVDHATEQFTGASLVVGDRVNDGAGTRALDWTFSDFQSAEVLIFHAELERDHSLGDPLRPHVDPRLLISRDRNPGVRVVFSDGSIARTAFEMPVRIHSESFMVDGIGIRPRVDSAPVPEPGAALLFGLGLLTVTWGRSSAMMD